MRRRALEAARVEWELNAIDLLPAAYPDGRSRTLRGPLIPNLMPSFVRFVGLEREGSMRPASRRLESLVRQWLHDAQAGAGTDAGMVVRALTAEVRPGEALLLGLVGGSGVRHYTHYDSWRPVDTWSDAEEWETRLLVGAGDGFAQSLAEVRTWLDVPENLAGYRSVLVGCPERDVVSGRWWRFATGVSGSPMPVLDLGSASVGSDVYRVLNVEAVRAPTLREFSDRKSHYFAVADGPTGFVSVADTDAVGQGSSFLDSIASRHVEEQLERIEALDQPEGEGAVRRVRESNPRLRQFYDRVWGSGFWLVHFRLRSDRGGAQRRYEFGLG